VIRASITELSDAEHSEAAAIYADVRDYALTRIRSAAGEGPGRPRRIALRLLDDASEDLSHRLPPIPCRRGCASCCTLPVHVDAVEVFGILDYMEKTFSVDRRERVIANVRAVSAAMRAVPECERPSTRRPCPFLDGQNCSIYPARPMMCRAHHSTDQSACDSQSSAGVPAQLLRHVVLFGVIESYLLIQEESGQHAGHWELVGAIEEALRDPDAHARLRRGETPFTFMVPVMPLPASQLDALPLSPRNSTADTERSFPLEQDSPEKFPRARSDPA
jgi:Fe-S-cluster containining protein